MKKRVFLIVLDSMGIGNAPDATEFGDEGSNTLASIRRSPYYRTPNLELMGFFSIDGVEGPSPATPTASFARMREASRGKDTTIGHWEIAGILSESPLPTYPNGFPKEVLDAFTAATGRCVLCNRPYSGTDVIRDFGEEHLRTGDLIVYTSADSVFQIAAHESIVPVETLYRYCEIAREILTGVHGVGRVIARPFTGTYPFRRTPRRHDFSLVPPRKTVPLLLKEAGYESISIGKIYDIFAGVGFTESTPTTGNAHGMDVLLSTMERDFSGLCFLNLVDFDMIYGHRNDLDGYARAMTEFDAHLAEVLSKLQEGDLLLITADHGCDPATPSTDHSRECTPLLAYGASIQAGKNLGTRETFADIGATVLEYFGLPTDTIYGTSFLKEISV